jgi:hypothetical protein
MNITFILVTLGFITAIPAFSYLTYDLALKGHEGKGHRWDNFVCFFAPFSWWVMMLFIGSTILLSLHAIPGNIVKGWFILPVISQQVILIGAGLLLEIINYTIARNIGRKKRKASPPAEAKT